MKKLGFMFALLVTVFSFAACSSDDDESTQSSLLEGTWGVVREEGYYYEYGQRVDYNDDYDPENPKNDDAKITISKADGGIYIMTYYNYLNGQWLIDSDYIPKFTLKGNEMIFLDDEDSWKITELTSTSLVIEAKGTDEDGDYYNKSVLKRM